MLRFVLLIAGLAAAQSEDDTLLFLQEEGSVTTGSLRAEPARRAPSTVHVLQGEDLRRSGAQTLEDALRMLPGVDVMSVNSMHGQVSLRGLNRLRNNRVLVLMDGRTVQNALFDFVDWETIPLALEDVERIEVVLGPASSIYGANAMLGVINIITKNPEQLEGVRLNAWYGEQDTLFANEQTGGRRGPYSYRHTASYRVSRPASEAGSFTSEITRSFTDGSELGFSGGVSDHDVETSPGSHAVGVSGFLRGDYRSGRFFVRSFWNASRARVTGLSGLGDLNADYNMLDALAAWGVPLPYENDLVLGAQYRFNQGSSGLFPHGRVEHNLGAFFIEDEWHVVERVRVLGGLRMDQHPHAGWVLSPRASVIWEPVDGHSLRATASESFRNPTLLENEIDATLTVPGVSQATLAGNTSLEPEMLDFTELGYVAEAAAFRAGASLFQYRLRDQITVDTTLVAAGPPQVTSTNLVNRGSTKAQGGELSFEWRALRHATLFANYSLQTLEDSEAGLNSDAFAPRHKGNAGARCRWGAWTGTAWLHAHPDYALLNLYAGYAFISGLEAGVSAFNAANARHQEAPGGARLGRRVMGTLSWRF